MQHLDIHKRESVPVLRRVLDNLLPARQMQIEEESDDDEDDDSGVGWRGVMGLAGLMVGMVGLFAWRYNKTTKTGALDVAAPRQPDVVRGATGVEVDSGAGVVELGGVPLRHVVAVDQVVDREVKAAAAADASGGEADAALAPAPVDSGPAPGASGDAEAVEDFTDASEDLEDVDHPIPHEAPEYLKAYLRLFHTKYPNRVWERMDVPGAERITWQTIQRMSNIVLPKTKPMKGLPKKRVSHWAKNIDQIRGNIKKIYYQHSVSGVDLMKILNSNTHPTFFTDVVDIMYNENNNKGSFIEEGTSPIPWKIMCVAALFFYMDLNRIKTLTDPKCTVYV